MVGDGRNGWRGERGKIPAGGCVMQEIGEPLAAACGDDCGCTTISTTTASDRLWRWASILTALTIGWNALEALVAIGSGVQADSIALVGFGLDSLIEVSSALVIVWRLTRRSGDCAANER